MKQVSSPELNFERDFSYSVNPAPLAHLPAQAIEQAQLLLQQQQMPLQDHNDLFVLDLEISLRSLCLHRIIQLGLPVAELPCNLRKEIAFMTETNNITSSSTKQG